MSSYQLLHTEVILHGSARRLEINYFKFLQFFGGVSKALIVILIYQIVYVLSKNCYNMVYLVRYRFKFKGAACVTIKIKKA
jgi:hypothetical protein